MAESRTKEGRRGHHYGSARTADCMNSIPEDREYTYVRYIAFRHQGYTNEDAATKVASDLSAPALFQALRREGFPVCESCGEYSVGQEHCEEAETRRKRKPRRGGGRKVELPPPADADFLFREALDDLRCSLEMLSHRTEYLQDERFVASEAVEYTSVHSRDDWPEEEEWRELCEKLELDPEREQVEFHAIRRFYVGASQSPPGALTKLIAAYVVAGKPIEPLIEKLHPNPESIDWEKLRKHLEGEKREKGRTPGLLGEAQAVARLVRGGKVRRGPSTGELTPRDVELARLIAMLEEAGVSNEKIRHHLQDERLTSDDIARLRACANR
jgi:hypothetical protein